MKKSNSKSKAQSAFKNLGAVALITATIFFVACKQTGGGGGESTPKHAINFSVEGGNGTLKAKAYGVAETTTSPINVEEGKAVIFTATANDGYRVKGWTLDGNAVNGTAETYTLAVTQPATVTLSFELRSVKGGAVLILSPNKLNISVVAKTADGSTITVEGCTETTLASNTQTGLHATGTRVILKGNITELSCGGNKLAALNVQGLTALQELKCSDNQLTELDVEDLISLQEVYCSDNQLPELNLHGCTSLKKLKCLSNKLNAQAMTALLNALSQRETSDGAWAILYTEETDIPEGNCKDFTQSEDLKKAFDGAKKRNWTLQKEDEDGSRVDI